MPCLHVLEEDRILLTHKLGTGRTWVGRSLDCDLSLPSESISRSHLLLDMSPSGCRVTDRSRHGALFNGDPLPSRSHRQWTPLQDGDVLTVGPYRLRYEVQAPAFTGVPTAGKPFYMSIHEQTLRADREGVHHTQAFLRFLAGPHRGDEVALTQNRVLLGGRGADVELGTDLAARAATLHIVRGRFMLEPVAEAVFLADEKGPGAHRVRNLLPLYPGERVRIREHVFVVGTRTVTEQGEASSFGHMLGDSGPMRQLFARLRKMAVHEYPVLLTGESGTGKELAARGLHEGGERGDGPMVAVNCGSIHASLFAASLYGHVQGAYTGATSSEEGFFQRADGGTLFLDEVGEIPLPIQPSLLRALESGEVLRVGATQPEYPDVRVIAATNRDLAAMVRDGHFRADLYHRLAVLTVRLPALREHPEDIELLARRHLEQTGSGKHLDPAALAALMAHPWEGNVRALKNTLTRAAVLTRKSVITADDLELPPDLSSQGSSARLLSPEEERARIVQRLEEHDFNQVQTARALGLSRPALRRRMDKYGLLPQK